MDVATFRDMTEQEKYPFGKGICSCGCGEETTTVQGETRRFIASHNERTFDKAPSGCKTCTKCKEIKSIDEFGNNKSLTSGLMRRCRKCMNESRYANKKKNKEKDPEKHRRGNQNKALKHTFGITIEEKEAWIEAQENQCAGCGVDFNTLTQKHIHVDHCHQTGSIRGILCRDCNLTLGMCKDDTERLIGLVRYLYKRS